MASFTPDSKPQRFTAFQIIDTMLMRTQLTPFDSRATRAYLPVHL